MNETTMLELRRHLRIAIKRDKQAQKAENAEATQKDAGPFPVRVSHSEQQKPLRATV